MMAFFLKINLAGQFQAAQNRNPATSNPRRYKI
jgi:hypothetical protein